MSTGSRTPDQFIADILSPNFVGRPITATWHWRTPPGAPPEELLARVEAHLRVGLTRGPGEAVVRRGAQRGQRGRVRGHRRHALPRRFGRRRDRAPEARHQPGLTPSSWPPEPRNPRADRAAAGAHARTRRQRRYRGAGGPLAVLRRQFPQPPRILDRDRDRRLSRRRADRAPGRRIERVLADVKVCVEDWPGLRNKAHEIADNLGWVHGADSIQDLHTASELLRWLADDHFTFLGYREYDLGHRGRTRTCCARRQDWHPGTDAPHRSAAAVQSFNRLPARRARRANAQAADHHQGQLAAPPSTGPPTSTTSASSSSTPRATSSASAASSGLFSSGARTRASVRRVPVIRDKVAAVLERAGFAARQPRRARTCCRSWRPTRATSCSRPRSTSCCDDRDRRALPAGAPPRPGCSSARTSTAASCPRLVFLPRDRYTTEVRLRDRRTILRRPSTAEPSTSRPG